MHQCPGIPPIFQNRHVCATIPARARNEIDRLYYYTSYIQFFTILVTNTAKAVNAVKVTNAVSCTYVRRRLLAWRRLLTIIIQCVIYNIDRSISAMPPIAGSFPPCQTGRSGFYRCVLFYYNRCNGDCRSGKSFSGNGSCFVHIRANDPHSCCYIKQNVFLYNRL